MLIFIAAAAALFCSLRWLLKEKEMAFNVFLSVTCALVIYLLAAPKIGEHFPQVPTTYDNGQPVELALMRDANYPDSAFYLVQTDAKHYVYKEANDGKLQGLNTDSASVIVSVGGWSKEAIGIERYDPRFVHSIDYLFALPSDKVQYMFRMPLGSFHKNFIPS